MYHARTSIRKINDTVHRYIREIRKYENMTYKQLAQRTMNLTVKVFNVTRDFGIGLYKNYSLKIMTYVLRACLHRGEVPRRPWKKFTRVSMNFL